MTEGEGRNSARKISLVEKGLLGVKVSEVHLLLPGLLLTVLLAWASVWLSESIGRGLMGFEKSPVSAVIVVIILGLTLSNLLPLPGGFEKGFAFAVKKVLRLGIIMLGIRLSVFDVFRLGAVGVPIVVICIAGAILFTSTLNRRLRLPERLGTLIAVGTSICGVSAIVATAPAIEAKDEEVSYSVAVITVFGLVATLAYPYLAYELFRANAVMSGLFLGTSVHETAQVAGAGMIYADAFSSPLGLDVATITKMVRNVFMAGVIPLMAYLHSRRTRSHSGMRGARIARLFPLFIIGFILMAVVRSVGDAGINAGGNALGIWAAEGWKAVHGTIKDGAGYLLIIALAGVGLKTRLSSFKGLGWKPFMVGLGAAAAVGLISFLMISLLGDLIVGVGPS